MDQVAPSSNYRTGTVLYSNDVRRWYWAFNGGVITLVEFCSWFPQFESPTYTAPLIRPKHYSCHPAFTSGIARRLALR